MNEPTQHERNLKMAGDIETLRRCKAFDEYFLTRIREKIKEIEAKLLEDRTLEPKQWDALRAERWALREVLEMADRDYQYATERVNAED